MLCCGMLFLLFVYCSCLISVSTCAVHRLRFDEGQVSVDTCRKDGQRFDDGIREKVKCARKPSESEDNKKDKKDNVRLHKKKSNCSGGVVKRSDG